MCAGDIDTGGCGLQWAGAAIQHTRHRALRTQCAGRGTGLQLAELVRSAGTSEGSAGRDHEPPQAAQCGGTHDSHAGQKKVLLTITHEAATQIKALVANVRHGLRLIQESTQVRAAVDQNSMDRDLGRRSLLTRAGGCNCRRYPTPSLQLHPSRMALRPTSQSHPAVQAGRAV